MWALMQSGRLRLLRHARRSSDWWHAMWFIFIRCLYRRRMPGKPMEFQLFRAMLHSLNVQFNNKSCTSGFSKVKKSTIFNFVTQMYCALPKVTLAFGLKFHHGSWTVDAHADRENVPLSTHGNFVAARRVWFCARLQRNFRRVWRVQRRQLNVRNHQWLLQWWRARKWWEVKKCCFSQCYEKDFYS